MVNSYLACSTSKQRPNQWHARFGVPDHIWFGVPDHISRIPHYIVVLESSDSMSFFATASMNSTNKIDSLSSVTSLSESPPASLWTEEGILDERNDVSYVIRYNLFITFD